MQDRLELYNSKSQIALILLGGLALVLVGLYLISLHQTDFNRYGRHDNITFVHFIGYASVGFVGFCLLLGLRRLFVFTPAYVFDADGVSIGMNNGAFRLVPWREISGSRTYRVRHIRFLVVLLKDPQGYIARGGSAQRASRRANYHMCGSPVSLSASTLEISFDELQEIFARYYSKYGAQPGPV